MIFQANIKINGGVVSTLIVNIAIIITIFCNRICDQSIRAVSFNFFPVQIPSIGERIWIVCISIYFQLSRLAWRNTETYGWRILVLSIDPGLQMIFH